MSHKNMYKLQKKNIKLNEKVFSPQEKVPLAQKNVFGTKIEKTYKNI